MKSVLKFKVKPTPIFVLIVFIILCWYHFFYLVSFTDGIESLLKNENLITIVVIFSLLFCIYTLFLKAEIRKKYSQHIKYLSVLLLCVACLLLYTSFKYPNQDLFISIKSSTVFMMPIFSLIIIMYMEKGGNIENILRIMNVAATLWYIIIIVQVFLNNLNLGFFGDFKTYLSQYYNEGNYGLRINLHVFGNFMIIYNLICTKYNQKIVSKIFHLADFLLGVFCLIFIQQTRALIFYMVVCIAIWMFMFSERSLKTRMLQIILLLLAFYLICFTDLFHDFFSSFSLSGERAFSTSARLYAIDYYMDCFQKNPLFGNGFADGWITSEYFYIEHGSRGIAYYSDVGIFGLLGNIGLCSIVVFIYPITRMIFVWKNKTTELSRKIKVIMLMMIVYFIATMPTYIVTNGRNSLFFAIAIGAYEYINVSADKRRINE